MVYTFIETIARGGFGRVDRVQLADGTIAVRKVFDPSLDVVRESSYEKLRKRFEREVRVQSQLPPDLFIPVIYSDLASHEPWFLMPLADSTYTDKIQADMGKPIDFNAIADILNALEELHDMGYVHRDLKPSNILLHQGKWKLSDLGLVTPDPGEQSGVTSTHSSWGSRGYKAPEQSQAFSQVTSAADIYSFGCILHDYTRKPRIPFHRYTCNGDFGAVIEKCTEVEPRKRFKNIAALRNAILSLDTREQIGETPTSLREQLSGLDALEQGNWTLDNFDALLHVIRSTDGVNLHMLFVEINALHLERLHALDPLRWEELVDALCEWAESGGFKFEFCDILGQRLETIFTLGGIGVKARACLALADVGSSHTRWFVMRILCRLCSGTADEALARRLRVEIAATGRKDQFIQCATEIGRSISAYHPLINEVL